MLFDGSDGWMDGWMDEAKAKQKELLVSLNLCKVLLSFLVYVVRS